MPQQEQDTNRVLERLQPTFIAETALYCLVETTHA